MLHLQRLLPILSLLSAIIAVDAAAQEAATQGQDSTSVIDESPIASARAAAMGGAVVTVADDVDAAFHNPAGIGGLGWDKKKPPFIRKLYFPHVSVGGNTRSIGVAREARSEGAASDSAIGKTLVDAHAGEDQYGRFNMLGGVVFGRAMVVPFTDIQVAAVSHGDGSDLIDLSYRTLTGAGAGMSVQDPTGAFSLGYFGYTAQRSATTGTFTYDEIIDAERRSSAFADDTTTSSAVGHNAGVVWRMGKVARPTLGVAVKNVGGTVYQASGDGEDLTLPQDLTIGFSLTPSIGKHGLLNVVVEADKIEQDELSFEKKYRLGLELVLGGVGSYATFAVRGGYNNAGPAAGLSLNLGLIGLEASTQGVDIGAGNEKVIERRFTGTAFVNVAEF